MNIRINKLPEEQTALGNDDYLPIDGETSGSRKIAIPVLLASLPIATQSMKGLMSSTDKKKVDSILDSGHADPATINEIEAWITAQGYIKQGSTPSTTFVTADYVNGNFVTPDLLNGYATESWVNAKGYLVQGTTPSTTFVTADYVNNKFVTPDLLSGYATETWVSAQGFLTASAIANYATELWVNQRGFLTASDITNYATQTWVNAQGFLTSSALANYVTETWVNQQGFLTSSSLTGYATTSYVNGLKKSVRIGHTYAIPGEIKIASGSTDFICGFRISLPNGQSATLSTVAFKLFDGTATLKLQKNGTDITGLTTLSVTSTLSTTTLSTPITLADGDVINAVVVSVSGTPHCLEIDIYEDKTI